MLVQKYEKSENYQVDIISQIFHFSQVVKIQKFTKTLQYKCEKFHIRRSG